MKTDSVPKNSISDDERRLLIYRAADLSGRAENCAVASSFLTPWEQRTVFEAKEMNPVRQKMMFWGGYFGATRRCIVFLPDWISVKETPPQELFCIERERYFLNLMEENGIKECLSETICSLKLSGSGFVKIFHKDWLGALMALGIKRNVIGDIVTNSENTYLFAQTKCAEFIKAELCRVGRDRAEATYERLDESFEPERNFQQITVAVTSPRIDGVVHALCKISRETAQKLVESEEVEINYFAAKSVSQTVKGKDVISVRGYGKFIIDSAEDVTKKGKIRISARKFV